MVWRNLNFSLASRAIHEIPSDTRRGPPSEDSLPDTFDVEDMSATKDYWGLISKSTDHANVAIIFCWIIFIELTIRILLIVLYDAIFIQAWQAPSFASEPIAFVATRMDLVATPVHLFDAFGSSADILKGLLIANWCLSEGFPAETAL